MSLVNLMGFELSSDNPLHSCSIVLIYLDSALATTVWSTGVVRSDLLAEETSTSYGPIIQLAKLRYHCFLLATVGFLNSK